MYYENGSFSLFYEKYGTSKNTILILPGWGDTRNTFNYLIENLKEDFTIYIIDNPPFGNSKIKEEDLTIYDYTNLIREFMLHEDITNPIIIAHSFGGRIATLLSSYYKDPIKKLILINIAGIKHKNPIKKYSYKLFKKLIKIIPNKLRKKINTYLLKKYSSSDYYSLDNNMKKTFQNIVNEDLTKYLKDINQETLILWGELDDATPLKDAYKIRKRIKNSELIVFKGANHYSYLNYPLLTLNIIKSFLK